MLLFLKFALIQQPATCGYLGLRCVYACACVCVCVYVKCVCVYAYVEAIRIYVWDYPSLLLYLTHWAKVPQSNPEPTDRISPASLILLAPISAF